MMFDWVEYLAFSLMLGLSALIGIYYGCYKGNQNTVSEYMQGGKRMGVFPIAMSLITSHLSGVTLLGVPAEIYSFGAHYLSTIISIILLVVLIIAFYLPVFYKLQLNSLYEYLERRFNHSTRLATSFLFTIQLVLYVPVVIYVPALAFNKVSGIAVHTITPIICIICTFYTTLLSGTILLREHNHQAEYLQFSVDSEPQEQLKHIAQSVQRCRSPIQCLTAGGLKAVVWTDALQSIFTFGSVIIIIAVGTISIGGPINVFKINREGHRLEVLSMDLDPFARTTYASIAIGMTLGFIAHVAVHPGAVQRFTAVPTYKDAVKSACWFGVGTLTSHLACVYLGFLLYAKYHDCDPVAAQIIKKPGQIVPQYIMDFSGSLPGLLGIFISGVVSASLSTMSACLNTAAGTIYEDFIMLCCAKRHSDERASFIMKLLVLVMGLICMILVYLVEKLGTIFQLIDDGSRESEKALLTVAISLNGITSGVLVYIFSFGLFFPWGTSKGALSGLIVSLVTTAWIVGGAQKAIIEGRMKFPGKITRVDGCPSNLTTQIFQNLTDTYEGVGSPVVTDGTVPLLYQLSYLHYAGVGLLTGFVVAIIISLITGTQDLSKLDPDLIVPQMRRFLPKRQKSNNDKGNKTEYTLVTLKNESETNE